MSHKDHPRSSFSLGHESLNLLHGEDADAFRNLVEALEEALAPAGELERQQLVRPARSSVLALAARRRARTRGL